MKFKFTSKRFGKKTRHATSVALALFMAANYLFTFSTLFATRAASVNLTITKPSSNETVLSDFSIEGTASSDELISGFNVEFHLIPSTGGDPKYSYPIVVSPPSLTTPWSITLNSGGQYTVVDGIYQIKINATDTDGKKLGNMEVLNNVNVGGVTPTVDNPPSVPTGLGYINPTVACGGVTDSYTITADWNDSTDDYGVEAYQYHVLTPGLGTPPITDWTTSVSISQYSGSFNQGEGEYRYQVRARDTNDNYSAWSEFCSITYSTTIAPVELTAPVIFLPADGTVLTSTSLVKVDWTDSTGDNPPFEYKYESYHNSGYSSLAYSSVWLPVSEINTPGTPEGDYYLRVMARDSLGNVTDWSNGSGDPYVLHVDNTAPFVEITSHDDGDTVNGIVDILGTVTDTNPSHYWINYPGKDQVVPETSSFTNQLLGTWDTTLVPDGQYTIKLEARDLAGNKKPNLAPVPADPEDLADSVDWVVVTVANPPAKPTGLQREAKVDGTIYQCGDITQRQTLYPMWDANTEPDFSHYEYTSFNHPDGSIGLNEVRMDTNKFIHNWVPPEDGTYGFAVRSVDLAGNKSDWALTEKSLGGSCQITYDSTPPEAPVILFPNEEDAFNNQPILNDWTDVDDISGIASYRIEYEYDDGHSFSGMPYRYTTISQRYHVPGTWEEGGVSFRVQAFDNAGNEGEWSEWRHYYYDLTAPVTIITSPSDNSFWNTVIPLEGSSSDEVGIEKTILQYQLAESADDWSLITELPNTEKDNPFNWTYGWIPTEGTYHIKAFAVDTAGNIEASDYAYFVTYDVTPPVVAITSHADGTPVSGTIEIRGSVTDINLSHYWINYPGRNQTVPAADSFTDQLLGTWDTTLVPDGQYTIKLEARDLAGNKEPNCAPCLTDPDDPTDSIDWVTVIVNNTPPPVVDIDESFVQMVNGYACGIGEALPDDGIKIQITNWNPSFTLQGRYYIAGGSYSEWFNLTEGLWGNGHFEYVDTSAIYTLMNTGDSPAGPAGWQARVLNGVGSPTGNTDQVDYIIIPDEDSLACRGNIAMGYETAETGPLPGVGTCPVYTNDLSRNSGNSALQVLKWDYIEYPAVEYQITGYWWNGSGFTAYSPYELPNSDHSWGSEVYIDVDQETNLVTYTTYATNENIYAYHIKARDDNNIVVAESAVVNPSFTCTFTVDRTAPPVPTHLSPLDGSVVSPVGLVIDWTDVSDPHGPIVYFYQSALDPSTDGSDNSLTSPIYTSGALSTSQIDASGSADNTYYWQVRACDDLGNCSNWSNPWELTVDATLPASISITVTGTVAGVTTVRVTTPSVYDGYGTGSDEDVPLALTITPENPEIGINEEVTLSANATGGTGSYTYAWTCSNGLTGTDSTIVFKNATAGEFECSVVVTDILDKTAEASTTINVGNVAGVDDGSVLGETDDKERICFWWWLLGIVALVINLGFVALNREKLRDEKWRFGIPLAVGLVAFLLDKLMHNWWTPSNFCGWMWVIALISVIVPTIIWFIVKPKEN